MDKAALIWLDRRTRFLAGSRSGSRLRRSARQWLGKRTGDMEIVVDGLRIYGQIGDREYLRGLERNAVEPLMLKLWKDEVRKAATVVDVGAYLGIYGMLAARATGSPRRVWAFEPNPESYRLMTRNVAENGFDNLVSSPLALSDRAGTARFHLAPGNRTASSLFEYAGDHDAAVEVETARLDDVLAPDVIVDVVKMDIEGGEVAALRGMERLLPSVQSLFVEYNPQALEAAGCGRDDLADVLSRSGFQLWAIDERGRSLQPFEKPPTTGYVNVLARRS